jgi:genome maintenance exonuclease 1
MRVYKVNEILYPSVTTVLKATESMEEALYYSEGRKYISNESFDAVMAKAANRGTELHLMVERFMLMGTPLEERPDLDVKTSAKALRLIETQINDYKTIETESSLVSPRLMYGGTADSLVEKDGVFYVVDLKTSKKNYSDFDFQLKTLQVAANAMLVEEDRNSAINCGMIWQWNVSRKTKGLNIHHIDSKAMHKAKVEFLLRLKEFWRTPLGQEISQKNLDIQAHS